MSARATPPWLHDVLGERFDAVELAVVLAFGASTATAVMLALPGGDALPAWRWAIAWLLTADIAAGCLANFTRSTSEYYAARPASRWTFIAVHGHLLVVAWAIGAPLAPSVAVWACTVAAATIVNALGGRPAQRFVAGALLASALVALPLAGVTGASLVIHTLFVLKVVYAFAVDHTAPADAPAPAEGLVLRSLSERDRGAFVRVVAAAFADDPLYVAALGRTADHAAALGRRAALTGYLFDMTRIVGGTARGVFVDGHLVAASLVEPPARGGVARALRLLAAAVRFLPLGLRLGGRGSALLNAYFRRTRAAAPGAPHHYLVQVGVRPDRRGRGFGRRLLEDAFELARRDPASAGLALDTESPANVARYRAWGFRPGAALDLGEVTAQTMFRPRTDAAAPAAPSATDP